MSIAPTTRPPAGNGNNALAPATKREIRVVQDDGPLAYLFDTARFEHMQRLATLMANASLTPKHLRGKDLDETIANCFRVANQAVRWGFDPFAVIDATYVVHGKLGYEGKLVAAVINARAGMAQPLAVVYNGGTGDDLAAAVFGSNKPIAPEAWPLLKRYVATEDGEAYTDLMALGVMAIRINVRQAKTDNDMWRKDPQQKLFYSGATKWARRHRPEIIMGVITDDDLERMTIDVEPRQSVQYLDAQLSGQQSASTSRQADAFSDQASSETMRDPTGAHVDLGEEHRRQASEVRTEEQPTSDEEQQEESDPANPSTDVLLAESRKVLAMLTKSGDITDLKLNVSAKLPEALRPGWEKECDDRKAALKKPDKGAAKQQSLVE